MVSEVGWTATYPQSSVAASKEIIIFDLGEVETLLCGRNSVICPQYRVGPQSGSTSELKHRGGERLRVARFG